MDVGAAIFFTDYSMGPAALGRALEERGFESLWAPEHSHIPLLARLRVPAGRRAAEEVLRRDGPVRHPRGGRGGHHAAPGGDRDLPGGPARPDPDRQGGGEPRPGLGRALPVRHRGGLERGGDGRPRHRVQVALRGDARAGGGDAAHLDEVQARVRGRVRQVPADDDLAQAGAEAAPAGAGRRRVSPRGAPGARLRRRLGAARAAARVRRRARQAARVRRARAGGRPGSGHGADHRVRGGRGRRPHQALPRRGRRPAASSTFPSAKADEVLPVLDRCAALMRQVQS